MKIVFLDIKTIGEDLDLTFFEELGEIVRYSYTKEEEIEERVKDADVLIVNKIPVNEKTVGSARRLKLVCVTATGTDNLDKEYLKSHNIEWRNVAGYSTESVAQHTFAMLFYLMENLRYYDDYVKNKCYVNDTMFTHFGRQFHQLSDMRWGIIGLGNIGRRVADLASMFGADVIYYSTSHAEPQEGYHQTDLDTLLSTSDIVSVHAPLNEDTVGLMDEKAFAKMKESAIFLNLGRGPIVKEKALADALKEKKILAAGLDVLESEPMKDTSDFLELLDSDRLLITPHIGWASVEARKNLMNIVFHQILDFLNC